MRDLRDIWWWGLVSGDPGGGSSVGQSYRGANHLQPREKGGALINSVLVSSIALLWSGSTNTREQRESVESVTLNVCFSSVTTFHIRYISFIFPGDHWNLVDETCPLFIIRHCVQWFLFLELEGKIERENQNITTAFWLARHDCRCVASDQQEENHDSLGEERRGQTTIRILRIFLIWCL